MAARETAFTENYFQMFARAMHTSMPIKRVCRALDGRQSIVISSKNVPIVVSVFVSLPHFLRYS